jgi:hypothetical protein
MTRLSTIAASSGTVYYIDRLSGWFKIYSSHSRTTPIGEGKLDKLRPCDRHCSTWVWWVRKHGAAGWQNPMVTTETQAAKWLVEEYDRWRGNPPRVERSITVRGITIN